MRQMWFRVDSVKAGKDTATWMTPDLVRLTLSEPVIERIEQAIASSSTESNPVAHSMGAVVETEIELPAGCLECLKMEAHGAPQVQYTVCDERFVRPVVLASAKGVALRTWGAEHEAMLRTERIALHHFHARVREARSEELMGAMQQAMEADAAHAPARKNAGPEAL